jgi:hypothetical protein
MIELLKQKDALEAKVQQFESHVRKNSAVLLKR